MLLWQVKKLGASFRRRPENVRIISRNHAFVPFPGTGFAVGYCGNFDFFKLMTLRSRELYGSKNRRGFYH